MYFLKFNKLTYFIIGYNLLAGINIHQGVEKQTNLRPDVDHWAWNERRERIKEKHFVILFMALFSNNK